jgi:hypothetical protein
VADDCENAENRVEDGVEVYSGDRVEHLCARAARVEEMQTTLNESD